MLRSLSPQDPEGLTTNYNTFKTLKTPLKVHKDTQGYYPYKKQFYIYKGI